MFLNKKKLRVSLKRVHENKLVVVVVHFLMVDNQHAYAWQSCTSIVDLNQNFTLMSVLNDLSTVQHVAGMVRATMIAFLTAGNKVHVIYSIRSIMP